MENDLNGIEIFKYWTNNKFLERTCLIIEHIFGQNVYSNFKNTSILILSLM